MLCVRNQVSVCMGSLSVSMIVLCMKSLFLMMQVEVMLIPLATRRDSQWSMLENSKRFSRVRKCLRGDVDCVFCVM